MTDEFFDTTTQLRTIRQWARARYAAPWAVFGAVLLRVAATTGPEIQLPGVIGGRASLNLLAAFVAPSGGGKGISDKVARLAWPAPIIERPVGSGEGIAATFMPPKKPDTPPTTRAIISVPEIDTLAGLAARQGSVLLAQLKSAAMGEQLGQSNASEATTRIIAPHSYRLCMSVGAQPAHTGVLFDDTTGGTPQRFLWFLTIDPDMPADAAPDPDPLDTELPLWCPGEDGVVEITYGPPQIAEQIVAAHIARQRGEAEALDGHAMLTRCKVAAVLAILHRRSVVSELDWQLSETVMAESARVRDWIVTESRKAARKKIRDRALAHAAGEEFIAARKLDRAKAAVLRWLDQHDELSASALRRRARSDWRDQMSAAIEELNDEGLIIGREVVGGGSRGMAYRLSRGGSTPVHPGPPLVTSKNGGPPLADEPRGGPPKVQVARGGPDQRGGPPESAPEPSESEPEPVLEKPARPVQGICPGCFVHMPLDPQTGRCEECDDPAHRVLKKAPKVPMTVVHSGGHKEEDHRTANGVLDALTIPALRRRATP